MKFLILFLISISIVSCSTIDAPTVVNKPTATQGENTKLTEQKIPSPIELQKAEQLENLQIDNDYKNALKTNICEKQYWSRYEFAEYFIHFAKIAKITPYDVIAGDTYQRRDLKGYSWDEFFNNYAKYVGSHMPDQIRNKFDQEFESEEKKTQNQKSVFNMSIKRDYDCYKKLK